MGKDNIKRTNEYIIDKSKELHGEHTYGYDKLEYINTKSNIILLCNKCNDYFSVTAGAHVGSRRVGCQRCSAERRTKAQTGSKEQMIAKALLNHPHGAFNYDRVEYKTARIKVEIGCNTCGVWFWQEPHQHTIGVGCKNCRNIKLAKDRSHSKEQFIEEAIKITGDKYDYSLVEYKNARTYAEIICNDCGSHFKKKPTEILNGQGCKCHNKGGYGYDPKQAGILYVLECGDITKIGITNKRLSSRIKAVSSSFGAKFKEIKTYNLEGQFCTDLETQLLIELRSKYRNPIQKFDGYTECFYYVDRAKLLNRIEELIKENK
jgi:hypothetical protein